MPSLLDLPVELLEEIASHVASKRKYWSSRAAQDELSLRLLHTTLDPIFTISFFKHCIICINPRLTDVVAHLSNFTARNGIERHVTSLEVTAPNFLQRTHDINRQIYGLISQFVKLQKLNLALDGHFIRLDEFPKMGNLKHLILQGESLYSQLHSLPEITPKLTNLDILAPALSRAPPETPISSRETTESLSLRARDMPVQLTHLHISNINTPSLQTLLLDLPFRPVHFSFSLLHNYDLSELVMILCRDCFCTRTVSVNMVKSKLVAPARLNDFKERLYHGLARKKEIQVTWSHT